MIKSFEEACLKEGVDPNVLPDVSMLDASTGNTIIAFYKLCIIVKALNGDWVADMSNRNQWKHYPVFVQIEDPAHPSGVGLRYHDWTHTYSHAGVGARLAIATEELADYAGETFTDLYADYLLVR